MQNTSAMDEQKSERLLLSRLQYAQVPQEDQKLKQEFATIYVKYYQFDLLEKYEGNLLFDIMWQICCCCDICTSRFEFIICLPKNSTKKTIEKAICQKITQEFPKKLTSSANRYIDIRIENKYIPDNFILESDITIYCWKDRLE